MDGYPIRIVREFPTGSNVIGSVGITNADAFNRIRVSDCFTLGDYKHIYGIDPNFLDLNIAGGNTTFVKNKACCTLNTSGSNLSRVVHQTRAYHHYQPGKSHLILSSFNFNGSASNVIKRTGYYDDNDGIYLELDGLNRLSFNIRSYVSGSAQSNQVFQSAWSHDRLDGTGPSGISLDLTKTQLVFFDFQWLGVGRVRCGFVENGTFITAHEYYHSNRIDTVYISTPTLPIRCEIFNTATLAIGSSMDQICSTVISEGGYTETGSDFALISTIRTIAAGIGNTIPIICIALKQTHNTYPNRILARLLNATILSIDNNISYKILRLDSISYVSNGTWSNADANSGIQYTDSATTLTNTGVCLSAGFAVAGGGGANAYNTITTNTGSSTKQNFIAQNIQGNDSSVYVILGINLATTTSRVAATIQWRELF